MAERVDKVTIRIVADASGVSAEASKVGDALGSAGQKAAEGLDKATTAANGLGDKATKAGTEAKAAMEGVLGPSAKLEAQITKTGNALSPRGIIDGAAKIRIALEDIEKEAARTGKAIGPDLAAQMKRAETAFAEAIPRGGHLADTIADTRKQAGLAAESYKTLDVAGTGLRGVFGSMDDAGKGWVSTLGKMGIAAFGVTQAIGLARDIIRGANEVIQEQLNKADAWALKMDKVRASHETGARAIGLAQKGTIAYGASLTETIANLDRYTVAHGRNNLALEEMAKTAGVTVPTGIRATTEGLKNLDAVASNAFTKGSAAATLWAQANEGALRAAQESARVTGEVLPPNIQKAITAIDAEKKALEELFAAQKKVNEAHTYDQEQSAARLKTLQDQVKAQQDLATAAAAEATAARAAADIKLRALNEEEIADEQYHAKKKAILAEMDAAVEAAAAKEAAARKKVTEAVDAEIAANKRGAQGIAESARATQELAKSKDDLAKKTELQAAVERDLATGTGRLSDETLRLLAAEEHRTAKIEESTTSMQALVDQLNGASDANQRLAESSAAAADSISVHKGRLYDLKEATRDAAEQTNHAKDQFGSFKETIDLLGEALAGIT